MYEKYVLLDDIYLHEPLVMFVRRSLSRDGFPVFVSFYRKIWKYISTWCCIWSIYGVVVSIYDQI